MYASLRGPSRTHNYVHRLLLSWVVLSRDYIRAGVVIGAWFCEGVRILRSCLGRHEMLDFSILLSLFDCAQHLVPSKILLVSIDFFMPSTSTCALHFAFCFLRFYRSLHGCMRSKILHLRVTRRSLQDSLHMILLLALWWSCEVIDWGCLRLLNITSSLIIWYCLLRIHELWKFDVIFILNDRRVLMNLPAFFLFSWLPRGCSTLVKLSIIFCYLTVIYSMMNIPLRWSNRCNCIGELLHILSERSSVIQI